MKTCHVCSLELPIDAFPPNQARSDGRQSMCRACYSEYQREYHRRRVGEDPEYRERKRKQRKRRAARIRRDNHQRLLQYFADHPCMDCGEDDYVVLTFDHVVGQKSFTISDRLHTVRWKRLLAEIAKCEVVCANCHMRRTARRAGYYAHLA